MQVELHLVGTSSRWRVSGTRARIGRDPECEVALPAERYPMVSREHAILTVENGRIHLSDNQSTNGIFVKGAKTAAATLAQLDRFQLGKDGPEFEVHVEQPAAAAAATMVSREGSPGIKTRMDVAPADIGSAPTRIAKPGELIPEKPLPQKTPGPPDRTSAASIKDRRGPSGFSAEEEKMIEHKLSSLRNLAYLLVAMLAVLLGVVFYQSQQIDKNRQELNDLKRQAQGAVAQFTPALDERLNALDQRLNTFDQRLNQVDAKMKETEDQFMNRLNDELPKMLDKYVDHKMKDLTKGIPDLKH